MERTHVRNGALLLVEIAKLAERFECRSAGDARCAGLRFADQPGREHVEQAIGDLINAQLFQSGLITEN